MNIQPRSPVVPGPQEAVGVTERDVLVSVGWRVEGASASLRAVPHLLRGHADWPHPDVRYAVLLAPARRSPGTA